jgi:hypothetical protein
MLYPLKLPPGVLRNGTEYASKGRYYDAWLVRWTDDGTLKPVGGWRVRNNSAAPLTGMARAIIAWRDNSNSTWLAIGTHSRLYASDRAGNVYDVTPAGFVAGNADATLGGGYGQGLYGDSNPYGQPTPDTTNIIDATEWTLDTWGQFPVGISPADTKIYQWDLNTAHLATQVTNAPTCAALVVTPERFLFALGSTDPRTVQWCDQQNNTVWTPSTTNQAGSFPLQTGGRLMCGKVTRGGTLLFTDLDVWLAVYVGGTLVYGFEKAGAQCGVASRQAVAALDSQVVWMGRNGFWRYNGYVEPLACDIADFVFSNINTQQISKIYCIRDAANSEIIWHYPSAGSLEVDQTAVWNYKFNYWSIGRKARTCGVDRGLFTYPVYVGTDGLVYEHEVGFSYDGSFPYAEGGPLELGSGYRADLAGGLGIGSGDEVIYASWLLPDDKTLGDVTATFKTKFMPDDSEVLVGPYTLSTRTDVRFSARQVKVRFTGAANDDWRVGIPRLDLAGGGER